MFMKNLRVVRCFSVLFFDDASSVTVSGNQNHIGGIGNGNRIVFTSPEVKALKQRIKDLEKLLIHKKK